MNAPSYVIRFFTSLMLVAPGITGCQQTSAPQVVVYVAVDRFHAEPILKQFEAESGIRVRAVYDAESTKTTGLVNRLLAESQAPQCDVFWNNELAQTLLLSSRDVLAPYASAAAEDIPAELRDPVGYWTGIAHRARVIVYNTQHVAPEDVPRSIFDLANPRWRGKFAIADPQFGTTRTHVAALFAQLGPERAKSLLEQLRANEVRIVDGNATVRNQVAWAQPGASPVYVGLTDTDDVLAGKAEGLPIEMCFPDQDGMGTLLIPTTVSLVKKAPHPHSARRLVDYLVGPETEARLVAHESGYLPVRPPSAPNEGSQPAQEVRAIDLAPELLLEHLLPSSEWTRTHFHP